ncbi:MAG: hypothetical protein ACR2OZ_05225 [Verrucomicrobiales bacterium]
MTHALKFGDYGQGGGSQPVVHDIDIPVKAIWDISGTVPVKVWP